MNNIGSLSQLENQLGVKFSSAMWYLDWSDNFTPEIARSFQNHGTIPTLVWQPQIGGDGVSYESVISGRYDSYLNSFADSVKGLGFTLRISLAPEMNASWEPWGVGNAGNNTENFKNFWRYTVNKFHSRGANNIDWIWAPNIHHWGEQASFSDLYPGDSYVDFTGLDGYNWGTSQSWSSWQSFADVFSSSYADITSVSSKKVLITEVASSEQGGSKPQWITEMFRDIGSSFYKIAGFYWFNINKETDWRINSSAASAQAFSQAAAGNYSPSIENNQPSSPTGETETDIVNSATNSSQAPKNNQNTNDPSSPTPQSSPSSTFTLNSDNIKEDLKNEILPLAKTTFFDNKLAKKIPGKIKGAYIALADNNFQIDNLISPQTQVFGGFVLSFGSLIPLLIFI